MKTAIDKHRRNSLDRSSHVGWTDEQLLLEYRETGAPEVFSELVHRYERELFSFLRRYLGSDSMAEDAFQSTFLQLHLKADQFEAGRKLRPWLYMIATNQAIDLQRRTRRHRMVSLSQMGPTEPEDPAKLADLLLSNEPSPVELVDRREKQRWVRDAIDRLPDYMKLAVNLVYFQGLKYKEAAEVLSVPVGTVKSRLHAAILKLSEAWKSSYHDN